MRGTSRTRELRHASRGPQGSRPHASVLQTLPRLSDQRCPRGSRAGRNGQVTRRSPGSRCMPARRAPWGIGSAARLAPRARPRPPASYQANTGLDVQASRMCQAHHTQPRRRRCQRPRRRRNGVVGAAYATAMTPGAIRASVVFSRFRIRVPVGCRSVCSTAARRFSSSVDWVHLDVSVLDRARPSPRPDRCRLRFSKMAWPGQSQRLSNC